MGSNSSANRVCVSNAKGGTGKTTIAINVAGALNDLGHDVLLVDMDPQGNATEGLGHGAAYDSQPPTLFDALVDTDVGLDAVLVEHEEMDLIPSNVDMLQAERELTIAGLAAQAETDPSVAVSPDALADLAVSLDPSVIGNHQGLGVLDRALTDVEDDYDYVIVDAPPFYGQLTDIAMYAARNLVVPALTEATSERAIELLLDQVAALEGRSNVVVSEVGLVANRVETTNEDQEMLEWFRAAFPEVPVWEVRKRVALQRAFSKGTSVFGYDPSVDITEVFRQIAADIEAHFESAANVHTQPQHNPEGSTND